jgi:hypothetical protein
MPPSFQNIITLILWLVLNGMFDSAMKKWFYAGAPLEADCAARLTSNMVTSSLLYFGSTKDLR